MAWKDGHKRVIIETDSKAAILLLDKPPHLSPYSNLLKQIDQWRHKEWEVRISHIWREGNNSADCLAKDSLNKESVLHRLQSPPDIVQRWMNLDIAGVTTPR